MFLINVTVSFATVCTCVVDELNEFLYDPYYALGTLLLFQSTEHLRVGYLLGHWEHRHMALTPEH